MDVGDARLLRGTEEHARSVASHAAVLMSSLPCVRLRDCCLAAPRAEFWGAPCRTTATDVVFNGETFTHKYEVGSLGWLSAVVDEQLRREAGVYDAVRAGSKTAPATGVPGTSGPVAQATNNVAPTGALMWVSDALVDSPPPPSTAESLLAPGHGPMDAGAQQEDDGGDGVASPVSVIGRILMWVPGLDPDTGAPSKSGTWLEVVACSNRTVVSYQLHEHGRRVMRRLVYASDARRCVHELPVSTAPRVRQWVPEARFAAGYVTHACW